MLGVVCEATQEGGVYASGGTLAQITLGLLSLLSYVPALLAV